MSAADQASRQADCTMRPAADNATEPPLPDRPTMNSTTAPASQDRRRVRALFAIEARSELDVFEGWHDPDVDWNGWATPAFNRTTAEKVIAWATREEVGDPPISFTWQHDVLRMREADGDGQEHLTRIEPDADGRYSIGSFSWVWDEVHRKVP